MFFDSESSSSSTTVNNDKRNTTSSGLAVSGDHNVSNLTYNTTDAGAVKVASDATKAAIEASSDVLKVVEQLSADAGKTAYNGMLLTDREAQRSADTLRNNMALADSLAQGSNATAEHLASSGMNLADSLASQAGVTAKNGMALADALAGKNLTATKDALTLADSFGSKNLTATKDALTFGTQAFAVTSKGLEEALAGMSANSSEAMRITAGVNRDSLAFASATSKDAFTLADKSQGMVYQTGALALGFGEHIVDQALKSADISQQASANAVNQVARAYDTATNYQAEKATLDSRYMVVAGIVAIGLVAVKVLGK